MAAQLHHTFGSEVALLHSALTPEERAEQWHRIRRGEARVVVGTRSAIFAPVENIGLIIVDEEHDSSYKQESTPRYHARDTAVMRAKLAGATIVLGSATPSLESWHNAQPGKIRAHRDARARHAAPAAAGRAGRYAPRIPGDRPGASLLPRSYRRDTGHARSRRAGHYPAQPPRLLLRRHVPRLRRKAPVRELLHLAHLSQAGARHPTTARHAGQRLECHYCGYKRTVPKRCPKCDSEHLYFLGAGSQQGEERLQEIFPNARIGRMDRDTVRGRTDMERLLMRLHSGEINLLVGTQMIAKGHDIHGVTLVGVVGADFALGLPDFRAAERVFQLLTQVSGRAGRGELPGSVLVQTYHPDHYAIQVRGQARLSTPSSSAR